MVGNNVIKYLTVTNVAGRWITDVIMSQQLRGVSVPVLQIYFVVVNDKITKHAILARQPVHCYSSFTSV